MTLSVPTVRSSDRINCPPRMVGNLGNSMTLLRKPLLAARRSLFLGLGILALLAGGAPGQAVAQQALFRPAAVVNDDIISVLDLAIRLQLALVAAGVYSSEAHRPQIGRPSGRNSGWW